MARIAIINPNSSQDCSAGMSAALDPLRLPGAPTMQVLTLAEGPPAIVTWRHWYSVAEPMCRLIERMEAAGDGADAYVIGCASDPGIEAVRSATSKPVFGIFRAAVAACVARAERFGVIAMADSSLERHQMALRAMGLENRLAGEIPLNLPMTTLLDPAAALAALITTGRALKARGAQSLILGCTGMAHHRARVEAEVGIAVIEPTRAGAMAALAALVAD
jgi:Asp/Glu/hydantoin racemase